MMVVKNRYLFVSVGLLVLALSASPQNLDNFTRKYGPPDDNGHYKVRPDVLMRVSSKDGKRVREIVIDTQVDSKVPAEAIHDVLDEVIEELAPTSLRGRRISAGITFQSSCNSIGHRTEYDNVKIGRISTCESASGKNVIKYRAIILWKSPPP